MLAAVCTFTNSQLFWNKAQSSFQSAAQLSFQANWVYLWQDGKCVGECKFEVMCLRKTDGDGAMGMGAHVERGKAGWRTAGDRQTLIVMALISASLAPSFHMSSDILLLLHPLHLAGGVGSSLGCAARSDGKSLPNTGPLTYKLHH